MAMPFRGRQVPELRFGTSGLRGLVQDITDLEAFVNVVGFLRYAGVGPGDRVALSGDLRPSTPRILAAVAEAVRDLGAHPVFCGFLPTPALMLHGIQSGVASVMVTGSHIPFDRNGIKFNKVDGELSKADEGPVLEQVAIARRREYERPSDQSRFDDLGMFVRPPSDPTLEPHDEAGRAYVRRYLDAFGPEALAGLTVGVYEHSAVGRDLLVEVLEGLGANVVRFGRASEFRAIDTEAISEDLLEELGRLLNEEGHTGLDAVVSTDGDSDRPLVLSVKAGGGLRFHSGDAVGLLTAAALGADGVAVPVSVSDAVERMLPRVPVVRTRIGSPFVIEAMTRLGGDRVVGWEANGGFLVGSTLRNRRVAPLSSAPLSSAPRNQWVAPLSAPLSSAPLSSEGGEALLVRNRGVAPLPTRDAVLPIVVVLAEARRAGGLEAAFRRVPSRHRAAGLLDAVPPERSRQMLAPFAPPEGLRAVSYGIDGTVTETSGGQRPLRGSEGEVLTRLRADLEQALGLGPVRAIDWLDGMRVELESDEVVHVRPSGNAPQLRLYTVASDPLRAEQLLREGIGPKGFLLRWLEGLPPE
jgi:phosphomannomutase